MADSLLPPNSTLLEHAVGGLLARIDAVPTPIRTLWDAWTCPVELLPWLAWSLAVDQWETSWSTAQKRATIDAAILVHQKKGTPAAIKSAVAALGYQLQLTEWWQTTGHAPGTFGIDIRLTGGQTVGATSELLNTLNYTKNARSHLWGITYRLDTRGNQIVSSAQSYGISLPLMPYISPALLAAIEAAKQVDFQQYWYPEFFPSIPTAIHAAEQMKGHGSPSQQDASAQQLTASIANLKSPRISFPCPYELRNGRDDATHGFDEFSDNEVSTVAVYAPTNTDQAFATPRQPKTAQATINSVITTPSLQPQSWLDGQAYFSRYNEIARLGGAVVGFEFVNADPRAIDLLVPFMGQVITRQGPDLLEYRLQASISTHWDGTKLFVTRYAAASKYINHVETARDEATITTVAAYATGAFRYGFYYDQVTGKLHFITQNGDLGSFDHLDTATITAGLLSTAFPFIDSLGLGTLVATPQAPSHTTEITFAKQPYDWQLPFPSGTENTCKVRLWRNTWSEPPRGLSQAAGVDHFHDQKIVNLVSANSWSEPPRGISQAAGVDHFHDQKIVNLVSANSWSEPPRGISQAAGVGHFYDLNQVSISTTTWAEAGRSINQSAICQYFYDIEATQ